MGSFWDARAAEDAYYYVDNRLDYGSPDTERFWSQGAKDLVTLLSRAGARIDPGDEVVEIGCGLGRLTRGLAGRASHVRALDVSGEMIRRARDLNADLGNVTWIHGDGVSLDGIATESADACVSHVVFQHVPDPEVTLEYVREMGRVLRPGGWSAFQVSTDPDVHSRSPLQRLRSRMGSLRPRRPRGTADKFWLGSAVSLGALEAAGRSAGLVMASVHGAGSQYCVVRLTRAPA